MRGRSYIFLKSFEGWRGIRKFMGKCIFGVSGREKGEGNFWVMYGKEQYTKYIVIKVNYNNVN